METKCCGTCKWRRREADYGEWICDNAESDSYTDWTEYKDCCPEWEAR